MTKTVGISINISIINPTPPMDAKTIVSMLFKWGGPSSSVVTDVVIKNTSEKKIIANNQTQDPLIYMYVPVRSSWCVVNTVFRTQLCGFSQGFRSQIKWTVMSSVIIVMLSKTTLLPTSLMLSYPVQKSFMHSLKE